MTTKGHPYPTRVACRFQGKDRQVVLDQIRTVDKNRLVKMLEREKQRGVPAERIVLAGFSQGGAMALHTGLRYPDRLTGILALSCYLPLASALNSERRPENQPTPIFMAHGDYDAVIPIRYGQQSAELLQRLDYRLEWQDYDMGHEVCWEEIRDVAKWLGRVLAVPRA